MTFITQVVSVVDATQSATSESISTFFPDPSVYTSTTGYNSLTIQIEGNTYTGTLLVQFSPNQSAVVQTFRDTVLPSGAGPFVKTYPITDAYYSIQYTPNTTPDTVTISSRMCTTVQVPSTQSLATFDNQTQWMYDAFGKARISQPLTLLQISFPDGESVPSATTQYLMNYQQVVSKTAGTAAATNVNGMVQITCSTAASRYVSQSRNYVTYQPGKSILVLCSGIIRPTNNIAECTGRIGYFDDNNGLFFECASTSGQCSVNVRSATINLSVTQSDWNIDPMNGTGTSGINLNFANAQLFVMDAEWLGVGRVRFGFYLFGRIYYCHAFNWGFGSQSLIAPYTKSMNLPIRYELNNTTGGSSSMYQICSTVLSEGGFEPVGRTFTATASAGSSLSTTELPILALYGGGVNYYHQNIVPTHITCSTLLASNQNYQYFVYLFLAANNSSSLPTFATGGTPTTSSVSNYSVAQYVTWTGAPSLAAGGILIASGFFNTNSSSALQSLSTTINTFTELGSNVNNISDVLVITIKELTGTGSGSANVGLQWQEKY